MSKKKVLLIGLLSILAGNIVAQPKYTVEHYTSENGLPQNSIKSISVDSYGFVWLATEDGLARFDGHHFYVFNRANLPVTNNRVFYITHFLRDTSPNGMGRTQISYVHFPGRELVKIENGTAVLDSSSHFVNREIRYQRYIKMFPNFFEAKAVPDILGVGNPSFSYLLFTGSTLNDFYVCKKNQIEYYTDWKKKSQLLFHVTNLWKYFTLGERLYYYQDDGNITTIIQNKIKTSPLSGDILKDPVYSQIPQKSRLYWSSNADQAFLGLNKKLYILEPKTDGTLSTKLLVEDFDLVARGVVRIHFDQVSQKVYLGTLTEGLFVLTKHGSGLTALIGKEKLINE